MKQKNSDHKGSDEPTLTVLLIQPKNFIKKIIFVSKNRFY